MDVSENAYLLELWAKNICPWCGKTIPEGTRVGSGRKSDGGFCSLACYADYHALTLIDRAKKALDTATKAH